MLVLAAPWWDALGLTSETARTLAIVVILAGSILLALGAAARRSVIDGHREPSTPSRVLVALGTPIVLAGVIGAVLIAVR